MRQFADIAICYPCQIFNDIFNLCDLQGGENSQIRFPLRSKNFLLESSPLQKSFHKFSI